MKKKRKRTHRVDVAMNDKEYEQILTYVHGCGLSKQAYLLLLIKNRIPQPLPSDDFQEVIKQLRKIGNNLNQLTVIAHKTGSIDIMKYKEDMKTLNNSIVEIREQVYLPKEVS
ncbi:MobC family plasmid mobilization relaxosome protein [[Clostridium] innocuum]|nr:MobC family plasmid mobilization relaxosome protein [[Clostridium] innocuum]